MKCSKVGLELIKTYEGYRKHVYKDAAGLWTVGYGHLLTAKEIAAKVFAAGLTMSEAEQLLAQDVANAEAIINVGVTRPLTQGQFDALCSFVFNLGPKNFLSSTLYSKVCKGDFAGAAKEFGKWTKARNPKTGQLVALPGLVARRRAEEKLWSGK